MGCTRQGEKADLPICRLFCLRRKPPGGINHLPRRHVKGRRVSMKAKVAVFGILRFPPDKIDGVLPHLKVFVNTTQKSDGCILYEVAADPFDKGLIRFSELWPDRECLEKHLEAPHIGPWREQARKHGLLERKFYSYDITSNPIPV